MPVTAPSLSPQPWHKALAQPASEFANTPLPVISGRIPKGLRGTFYQNGTGRLQRGGEPVGHWFDGDGAILRVAIGGDAQGGSATGTYRYVQTDGYQRESEADKFLYGNYGMRYPGPIWAHVAGLFNGATLKNSANTSVLALADRLLALWEGGNPHSLDLETLQTFGKESLGWLKPTQPFSAHPLQDPLTGEIYSIGVNYKCDLAIYRCDRACNLIKQSVIALKDVPLVHSFVMAGPYLVFLISPVKVDVLPLLLNQKSYADALKWQSDRGTRIIVVDRQSLEVISQSFAESWFQWHFGNGCVDADGNVRLDFVRFDDFTHINEVLREIPTGQVDSSADGSLWQLRLNPKTGQVLNSECVLERDCEFPQVKAAQRGQPWRYTYLLLHRSGISAAQDWFRAIGQFDYQTGRLLEHDLGEGHYGSEPLYVADRLNLERGWLIEVVYSALADRSELWIFDAQRLDPVCKLALPGVVPLGFHGTWQTAKD
ncbi:MAG: carotenoid oxygenase family protein [Phormidesmis sp.]